MNLVQVWVGRGPELGPGQGMPKKRLNPRVLSGGGWGKETGACIWRGPVRMVTNSMHGALLDVYSGQHYTDIPQKSHQFSKADNPCIENN